MAANAAGKKSSTFGLNKHNLNQAKNDAQSSQKGVGKGNPPDIGSFYKYCPPYQSADKRNDKYLRVSVNNVQKTK